MFNSNHKRQKKLNTELTVLAHSCNPNTWVMEDCEFEASLTRPSLSLKKTKEMKTQIGTNNKGKKYKIRTSMVAIIQLYQ
jgi:hypothetical protein